MVVITDMGNMHIETSTHKLKLIKTPVWIVLLVSNGFILYSAQSYGIDWSITPTIQMQEIFSDNITLSSKDKKSAFVTSVSPGVSIIGQSAKHMLNLNYTMQNLYNANGNNGVDIHNQLAFNSQHTFIPDKLFLQTSSSISQQNISNTRTVSDNISGSGNRSNVSTVSVSPYWTPHFGNYADGVFRLNMSTVTSDANSSQLSGTNNLFSDTLTVGESAQLNSGTEFQRVGWNASFNNTKNYRSGGQDVSFQNLSGTIRTYINKYFNVFATAGYSDNSYKSVTNSNSNGFFYTYGARWTPSEHYYIEGGWGNNKYVTVYISPIQRVSWTTTYRDNSIGLNSGSTWSTDLRYQSTNSTWTISHNNTTQTTQSFLLDNQYLTSNVQNTTGQSTIYFPNLTDDVYVSKTWNAGVSYNTGKSTVGANAFDQKRTSQNSGTTDNVRGVSASWTWQFAPKTSTYLYPSWQQFDRGAGTAAASTKSKDNRYDITIGVRQSITQNLTGSLEFRHLNQSSELDTNNYQENRATASLFMRF